MGEENTSTKFPPPPKKIPANPVNNLFFFLSHFCKAQNHRKPGRNCQGHSKCDSPLRDTSLQSVLARTHALRRACAGDLNPGELQFVGKQKLPERIFLGKCCLKKCFLVFSCLAARPVKAHIALPMRKQLLENYWPTLAPRHSWHQD